MQQHFPHNHGQEIEKLAAHLPSSEDFGEAAKFFHLLGDPSRLKIFWILCHCEECVINISALMEMSSPAVSHHLRQLKAAGLITSGRKGKEVYYKAASSVGVEALHNMLESMISLTCPGNKSF